MLNIKAILCSTDLSNESDEAMRYALALARLCKAKVFVFHCAEVAPFAAADEVTSRVEEAIRRHVNWMRPEGVAWEPAVGMINRTTGDMAGAITHEAAKRGADLIVMESGRHPLSAAVFGSTAETVCRNAACPVLVTHPQEHEFVDAASGEVHLKRVLVADDFSEFSTAALSFGFSLAQEYQSELHIIHVQPPHRDKQAQTREGLHLHDSAEALVEHRLKGHVPPEVELWCTVKSVVREGKPDHEIVAYAKEQDVDLICVGSHGKGKGWAEFLGSTTDRVLRHAPCPTLVARPAGGAT
jgi:nucleotide-binding universal stress UspA family protein